LSRDGFKVRPLMSEALELGGEGRSDKQEEHYNLPTEGQARRVSQQLGWPA